jgi:Pre-SET motif
METQTQRPVSPASSVSSRTRTTSTSSSQPRISVADAITLASQSNTLLSPKSNKTSKHDAVDVRRANDDSDVEMASPISHDHSTHENAIASAVVLKDLIQQTKTAGQTSIFPGFVSSLADQYLRASESSSPSPHSRRAPMDEMRVSIPMSPLSEPRSVVTTSPVPPVPRRTIASPKKTISSGVSVTVNDVQARDGTHTSTSTSESVAQAISSSQSSSLPMDGVEAQPRKPESTSESVARAISLSQPSVVSFKPLDNILARGDSQETAQRESVAHAISSRQSSALPASQRSSQAPQTQPDVVPPSTSENVARAISFNKSSAPAEQARNRPSSADPAPSLSSQTQTNDPVASHPAKSSQEVLPSHRDSKLSTYLPSTTQSPQPNLPSKNLSLTSSTPTQQKTPMPSSPIRQSTLLFSSRATATDQLLKSASDAKAPPVRSFSSSTLVLTPSHLASTNVSSKSTRDPSVPPASKHLPLMAAPAPSSVTDKHHSPPKEAPESSNSPASKYNPSTMMPDAAKTSVMNVDQVTGDIPPNTIDSKEEEREYHSEYVTINALDSDSDTEVENLLVPIVPTSVSPPSEVSGAPVSSSVPAPTATVSSPAETPSYAGIGAIFNDVPEGRRRSSRLSSRSSSHDPMDAIAEDNEFPTPADSLPPSHSPTPDYVSSGNIPIRTYGGLPSLNWQTFRQDLSNFTPKCYYAKDLPHSLQDHINRWPESAKLHPELRHVLQSAIEQNTSEDEPDAPHIEIINNVDHEPTPPWEFHYSNKMWHTDGVPPPDVTRLINCGCRGKCDPKSKTCACIKRQQEYASDVYPDFAYDKNGRLRLPGYPIFECNDLCGCDDECRNRVCSFFRGLIRVSNGLSGGAARPYSCNQHQQDQRQRMG